MAIRDYFKSDAQKAEKARNIRKVKIPKAQNKGQWGKVTTLHHRAKDLENK